MAGEHILRVPRGDSEGDFVLVNVSSNGPSDLDVRLLATEGESPYTATSPFHLQSSLIATSSLMP